MRTIRSWARAAVVVGLVFSSCCATVEMKRPKASRTRPVTSAEEGSLKEFMSEKGILLRKTASLLMSNAA